MSLLDRAKEIFNVSKLKDKRIRAILQDGWLRIDDRPIPTNGEVGVAVAEHNRAYEGATSGNGANGSATQREWWGDKNRHTEGSYTQSRLPQVYQPPVVAKPQTDWTCPVEDVKGCPIAKAPIVEVPVEMYRIWVDLANDFQTEWIAYLIGEMDQGTGRGRITEMYFPPQSASGAHVSVPEDTEFRVRPGTIAAVHSHVKMAAFFSSTDRDHANWPIEIVVNAMGETTMAMRTRLECGRYARIDGKVMLIGAKASDIWREQLKAAIKPEDDKAGYGEAELEMGGHFHGV